ncbi:hypothetical protein GCM10028796_05280 [Ramlibacter monticola]|uniref:Uncharacterized protein n=1 Tax=Ramlibacter monticola TaxID=1926872 RepID=A0A936Z066_9BURK|nr:hypothetical protein [Ramlibacter monticola]MBL0391195.1 hypothetical protein [Ramlibacter monticola]
MPVWLIAPVEDRPSVTLRSWSVYEVPLLGDGQPWTRHFVGHSVEDRHGQVSSAVESFDPATGCGRTSSGRIYRLQGQAGGHADARHTWKRWKEINMISAERDVTPEVQGAIAAAITGAGPGPAG